MEKLKKGYVSLFLIDEVADKPVKKPRQLEIGDKVSIAPFGFEGKIVDINKKKKRAVVLFEDRHIETDFKNLCYIAGEADDAEPAKSSVPVPRMNFSVGTSNRNSFNPTLDLRALLSDYFLCGYCNYLIIDAIQMKRKK